MKEERRKRKLALYLPLLLVILVGFLTTTGRAWDVWVNGAYASIADRDLGLVVADVSAPSQPLKVVSPS